MIKSYRNKVLPALTGVCFFCFFQSTCLGQPMLEESVARGKKIYKNECASCHMEDGQGITGAFPPLAQSDYFADDISKAVDAILNGLEGELIVNENTYYGVMDPVALSDDEMADILNFIRNAWGSQSDILTAQDVAKIKNSLVKDQ